jgi:hypothetical protein
MALDFPASPNLNDTYTFGGVTWTYDGTTWKVLGRFQFTSSETDPVFTSSPAFSILNQNITNWNLAYGWGDHSTAGYLTSIGSLNTITDVNLAALQDGQLLRFNAANGKWENWTSNYLTSFVESDPIFATSPAGGITGTNIANWNTAYNWGDHSTQGYLTSYTETGTLQSVTDNGASSSNSITLTNTLNLNAELHMASSAFRIIPNTPSVGTHTIGGVSGIGGIVFRCGQSSSISFTNENGTNTFASISASGGLTAGGLTYPTSNGTVGQVLTSDGAGNVTWGGAGAANVIISDTAPGSPNAGDLWWESDKGRLKVYYNDTDSSQWVDASPPLQQDRIATSAAPATATSTGTAGEIRYDADYVYICVATNTWKRAALTTW